MFSRVFLLKQIGPNFHSILVSKQIFRVWVSFCVSGCVPFCLSCFFFLSFWTEETECFVIVYNNQIIAIWFYRDHLLSYHIPLHCLLFSSQVTLVLSILQRDSNITIYFSLVYFLLRKLILEIEISLEAWPHTNQLHVTGVGDRASRGMSDIYMCEVVYFSCSQISSIFWKFNVRYEINFA